MRNRERDLKSLYRGMQHCRKCRLCETRKHAVPGEGPFDAPIMFIGEAPGEQEDLEGRPFRGRSGEFFDELLASIGIRRQDVYVTSSVKCRPPGNRAPRPDELEICRKSWVETQIDLVDPDRIVLLGRIAARQLLCETRALRDFHGTPVPWQGRMMLPTYHPAAGMRFPAVEKRIRADFQRIQEIQKQKRGRRD